MAKSGKSKTADTNICRNKRALHDYFIEESFEAGMVLLGWEVTHVVCEPDRSRKLLLSKKELARLFAKIQQKGYTSVCTSIYWKGHLIKCQVALAKGKQEHDKRNVEKDREWAIEKQRVVRHAHR